MRAIIFAAQGLATTDGTSAGTTILKATQPGPGGFRPIPRAAVLDGRVVFVGQDIGYSQLWITDGTGPGTTLIVALDTSDLMQGVHAAISDLTSVGSHVVFQYKSGDSPTAPGGLWTTDGTLAGTQQITLETSFLANASALLANGRPVFAGNGLWVTDGTAAGTLQLRAQTNDFKTGFAIASLGPKVLFGVLSGGGANGAGGVNQLWTTDGTAAGTELVIALAGDAGNGGPDSFVALGGRVLFSHEATLWVSDGTSGGTFSLPSVGNPNLADGAVLGDQLVFNTASGLHVTDGTVAGTSALTALTGNPNPAPRVVALGNSAIFVVAQDAGAAKQIWKTDGTVGGTELVTTLPYSGDSAGVIQMASIGDRALITVWDGVGDNVLWSTDGTAAGTMIVLDHFDSTLFGLEEIPCFARGTRIATLTGAVPVEALRAGDMIPGIRSGRVQGVVWIGYRRVVAATHPRPAEIWPVCVRAGAIAPAVPSRDVWLSPEHGVFLHGVLVPVRLLINGMSIVQRPCAEVTYYHVELAVHDLVLTEGMLSESYLDTGNRADFENGTVVNAHPAFAADYASRVWGERACAPQVRVGKELAAIQATLARRAQQMMDDGSLPEDGGKLIGSAEPGAEGSTAVHCSAEAFVCCRYG